MADIITEADLASYLQTKIPAGSADFILRLTNAKVRREIGDLDDTSPVWPDVQGVAVEVAARARRNPQRVSSETKSIDDWSQTRRWGENGSAEQPHAGAVYLTDEERRELRLLAGLDVPSTKRRSIQLRVPGYQQ